jgi:hypothetical protein
MERVADRLIIKLAITAGVLAVALVWLVRSIGARGSAVQDGR